MRPLGFTETKEGRALSQPDALLQELWHEYHAAYHASVSLDPGVPLQEYGVPLLFVSRLNELRPTKEQLYALILRQTHADHYFSCERLGIFVSAGLQLLPEREIVYPLHTPPLLQFGYGLVDKHLIITGSVGMQAGLNMIGDLTILGSAGRYAGDHMVGTHVTNGSSPWYGFGMIGVISHDGERYPHPWNIPDALVDEYCHDITNPRSLSHHALRTWLREKYEIHGRNA
jgi:hypothetical protein